MIFNLFAAYLVLGGQEPQHSEADFARIAAEVAAKTVSAQPEISSTQPAWADNLEKRREIQQGYRLELTKKFEGSDASIGKSVEFIALVDKEYETAFTNWIACGQKVSRSFAKSNGAAGDVAMAAAVHCRNWRQEVGAWQNFRLKLQGAQNNSNKIDNQMQEAETELIKSNTYLIVKERLDRLHQ
ncbi:hypothetical protein ACFSAG_00445 [Sphingorhabdus buctiana]|uniref:DUF1311 domain-containing protein n=1 Tax=Sphingorhabdus buctiana TaxID=1508805 RepID=A0ABW4MAD6_9SPHN